MAFEIVFFLLLRFLLPTKSFQLDATLLEYDTLRPITSGTRGHLGDAINSFNIPLIDFMDLEGAHAILGRGGNAVVFSAKYQGSKVAVKKLHKKKINAKMVKNFLREALLSTKFNHDNILRFHVNIIHYSYLLFCFFLRVYAFPHQTFS